MTDDIQSILLSEMFVTNCKIRIKGDHFFADRKLYSNLYGIAFFSETNNFSDNPHISSACARLPGILDEYFGDLHDIPSSHGEYELSDSITARIDEKYLAAAPKKKTLRWTSDCSFLGNISLHPDGSYVICYGTVLPTTLCISHDALTAILPFSPFSNLSLLRGKRTLQSVDYPLPATPFAPPEDITIDFATSVKKLSYSFADDLSGRIELEYSVEVGVTKCEQSKMIFEISPYFDTDDDDTPSLI